MAGKLGFIGLGNMGAHMARNLMKNGRQLVVFDVQKDSCAKLKSDGASVASSPAEVASQCSQIITMLPSSPHVNAVYGGEDGIFKTIKPSTLCIDSSTIDPAVSKTMAARAMADHQCTYLDAPVSGGVVAAENGKLTFMVGGCAKGYAQAEGILQMMGANVLHTGESGTGQAAKICNNMLLAISMIGTSETMNLGQSLGLDAKMLAKILNMSTGRCWSSELYNPVPGVVDGVPSSRNYHGGFGAALMAKDLGLAQNASTAVQAATPLGSAAHQIYRLLAQSDETGGKDFSVVYQFLKKQK